MKDNIVNSAGLEEYTKTLRAATDRTALEKIKEKRDVIIHKQGLAAYDAKVKIIINKYGIKWTSYKTFHSRWTKEKPLLQALVNEGYGSDRRARRRARKRGKGQRTATSTAAAATTKRPRKSTGISKSTDLLGQSSGLSIAELDSFTSHLTSRNVLDAANELIGSQDHINGAIRFPISVDFTVDCTESLFGRLIRETTEDGDSLRLMEKRLIAGINGFLQNSDCYSEYQVATAEMLQQQHPHSDVDPQVPHQDLAYMVNEEYQQVQGVVMFTAGSQSTIVYDMSAVPNVVSPADVAAQFFRMIPPMPGCEHIDQLLEGNPKVMGLLSKYGRLLLATDDKRPPSKIASTQYSVTIMGCNNPHCGPGLSPGAKARLAIFFTAKHRQAADQAAYRDEQMSREKLMAHLVHNLRPLLLKDKQLILLTYLSQIWTEYVCNSASHNSYDGTAIEEMTSNKLVPKQAISDYAKLCEAALAHREKRTKESEADLTLAKNVFGVTLLPR